MKKFYPIIFLYVVSCCMSGCSDTGIHSHFVNKKMNGEKIYYSGWNKRFILKRQDKEEERIGWQAQLRRLLEGRIEYSRVF